jgi:hypothetical protein
MIDVELMSIFNMCDLRLEGPLDNDPLYSIIVCVLLYMMDNITGIVLLESEPTANILAKWLAWMLVMVLVVMVLIYFSNWFATSKSLGCNLDHTDYRLKKIITKKNRI